MRSSGERCISRSVSRARSSGNTLRNGDCSSATASATLSAPSNTGSPVVFSKSARTIVSCSVSVASPRHQERTTQRRSDGDQRRRAPPPPSHQRVRPRPFAARRAGRAVSRRGADVAARLAAIVERRRRPIARIRRERLHDDPLELRVDVRDERRGPRRPASAPSARSNGVLPDEQLVQHQAERVDVGALGQRRPGVRCSGAM